MLPCPPPPQGERKQIPMAKCKHTGKVKETHMCGRDSKLYKKIILEFNPIPEERCGLSWARQPLAIVSTLPYL